MEGGFCFSEMNGTVWFVLYYNLATTVTVCWPWPCWLAGYRWRKVAVKREKVFLTLSLIHFEAVN